MKLTGKAWKFGNNVDTDVIIPARYLNTSDPSELAKHCMEDIDPEFADGVREGDIIVGGANFGCGSSREHAPISIKAAGVSCIVAEYFARIFYRNSFNMGLPIVECQEAAREADAGDILTVDLTSGRVINETKNRSYESEPVPIFMQELLSAGGLMPYTMKNLSK
ncbi:MAG TPA: 3-isopropylmalate dehydratase small subunit [Nitrospinota bacterium]|jgi:3-isopropylmalate/(R)-2-methylmalate dehydratase small subunit|nr:3-isopropylmalate dehydratase small subunit [Nitrospinota bacterium]|tara:strand:- start:26576 stop:27070 length:495 start_codon:yes stop_codon:yes gene_type:complete